MDEQIPLYAHENLFVCDPQFGIQRTHSFYQAHSRLPLLMSYTLSFHFSFLAQLGVELGGESTISFLAAFIFYLRSLNTPNPARTHSSPPLYEGCTV